MQSIADMVQVAVLGATITLGILLLITILRLRKMRKMSEKLIMQIEAGDE